MLSRQKHLLTVGIFLFLFIHPQRILAQQWSWVVNAAGNNQYSNADREIAVDNDGIQFIAGYFTETLTLGSFTLVNPDNYYSDMYLAKIDSSGNVIWAQSFDLGSTYNDAMGICIDDSDNIFLTGAFDGKIFVKKYDSSGLMMWNSNISEQNFYGYGRDIGVDQYENVYITGQENGSSVVAKLSMDGNYQWSAIIQGCNSNGAWGNDLAVDRLGNCYMAGGFSCDSVIIGSTILRRAADPWGRSFLVKYSAAGKVLWVNMPEGPTNSIPQITLTDSGYVLLSGTFNWDKLIFNDSVIVYPNYTIPFASYIAKYDSSGKLIWAKDGSQFQSTPRDVVSDYDGNFYFSENNSGNNEDKMGLVKYNRNGDTTMNGLVGNGGSGIFGIDIDDFGNTYMVGHSPVKGLGVLGPGYLNPYSVFVAKFNTGSATRRRPRKPLIEREITVCAGDNAPLLFAPGSGIRWYKDSLLNILIASSNNYQPGTTKTDTLYVTQSVDGMQSWPQQVIIYISTLTDFSINRTNDSLFAPAGYNYTYQWFLDNVAMPDSEGGQQRAIVPKLDGNYKVALTDNMVCSKEASYSFSLLDTNYFKFTLTRIVNAAMLTWKIPNDSNIVGFEPQKSDDQINFTTLSHINRPNDTTTEFTYTDSYLRPGNNYYCIRVFTASGNAVNSIILFITYTDNGKPLKITPNIVRNSLIFSLQASELPANCTIRILGSNGTLFYNNLMPLNNGESKELNVDILKAGTYYLEVYDGKNKFTAVFIKQ